MTRKQVRTAFYFGSKSHLRSKAAKREILLWAGEVDRVTRSRLFEPFWSVLRSQTTLEGPLHPFLVFGLKTIHNFTPWSFPLLTPKRPLYFQAYYNHAISGMDSRQATTTKPECIVPHSTTAAPFSLQPYTINTLFRSAKHIFCAEIYTYTPGANPPETAGSVLTNHITPRLVSSLTPIKRLLELFLQFYSKPLTKLTREILQIWSRFRTPIIYERKHTIIHSHHFQMSRNKRSAKTLTFLTTSCAHLALPPQTLAPKLASRTRTSPPHPNHTLTLGPPPQEEGPCDYIKKIEKQ